MVDWAEVEGRARDIASAMHEAHAVLGRAAWLLDREQVGTTMSRQVKNVDSATEPVGQLRRLEGDAMSKRRRAWETGDRSMAAESEDADAALRSAYKRPQHEIAGIADALREPAVEVGRLHDDLTRSRSQLGDALGHAAALHDMPGYGGSDKTKDLLANVEGLKQIVDKVERKVGDGLEELKAARTIASRFGQEPPNVKGGQIADDLVSTSGKVNRHLTAAGTAFEDAHTFRLNDVASARQYAVDFAGGVQKAAAQLDKNVQAATNPTPSSAQQTQAQSDMRRRLEGHAHQAGVER
ncbi:MAG TPA: hypothetical protein VGL05_01610 [Kribbella sp.]